MVSANIPAYNKLATAFLLTGIAGQIPINTQENINPNIVLILADDLGFGDVSIFNPDSKIRTSNIDSLARQGLMFTDAHSNSSVSSPTRYGILTGRYCWRTSLQQGVLDGYSDALIPDNRLTVASVLKASDYTTGCIGKWHLGWSWGKTGSKTEGVDFSKSIDKGPLSLGFDYFYGISASLDMPPYVYIENNHVVSLPDTITENSRTIHFWRKGPAAKDFFHGKTLSLLASKAKEYIEEKSKGSDPFFLYFALPAPHTPVLPSAEFRGKSSLGDYGDYVLEVDHIICEIVKTLKDEGVFNNTLLIITSDNGCSPAAGTKELEKLGHFPSADFRGYKADLYEGGHRVPLVISWPDKIKKGSICKQLISTTDFMATFAQLTGYPLPGNQAEDSFSFYPLIVNSHAHENKREDMVHHSIYGNMAIRKGDWKLLFTPYSGGWSFPRQGDDDDTVRLLPNLQLYNLNKDPGEKTNLVNRYPVKVKELKKLMIRYIENGRSTPGEVQKNDVPVIYKFELFHDFR